MKYLNFFVLLLSVSCSSGNDFTAEQTQLEDSGVSPADTDKVPPQQPPDAGIVPPPVDADVVQPPVDADVVQPPVDAGVPPPLPPVDEISDSDKSLVSTINKLAATEAEGSKPVEDLLIVHLQRKESFQFEVHTRSDHCYTVIAVGDSEVADVKIELIYYPIPSSRRTYAIVATDNTIGSPAILPCFEFKPVIPVAETILEMRVTASRGFGKVAVQVYETEL